ncbi:hypothetical protein ABIB73_000796 [Bradyrhizobium sp. F1.4.3]
MTKDDTTTARLTKAADMTGRGLSRAISESPPLRSAWW